MSGSEPKSPDVQRLRRGVGKLAQACRRWIESSRRRWRRSVCAVQAVLGSRLPESVQRWRGVPFRLKVGERLLLALCSIRVLSTGLALILQERSLSGDLEGAARDRLQRASFSAHRLVAKHLGAMGARYRAISGTPQFRANLEVAHAPTLAYYAAQLRGQQDASLILFLDRDGEEIALAGDRGLADTVMDRFESRQSICEARTGAEGNAALGIRLEPCDGSERPDESQPACVRATSTGATSGPGVEPTPGARASGPPEDPSAQTGCEIPGRFVEASLMAHQAQGFSVVSVPLYTGESLVGHLLALEEILPDLVRDWSKLCGARVEIGTRDGRRRGELEQVLRQFGDLELRVTSSLLAERNALAHSRRSLLTAGLIALLLAFVVSFFHARELVSPIREIQRATDRIGPDDLTVRLEIDRPDEIGDVARAFNRMLERLQESQGRLASAQRIAHLGNWALQPGTPEMHCSDEFRRIYAIGPEETPVTIELLLCRIHPEDREVFQSALERCLERGEVFRLDHRMVAPDGSERILHSQGERLEAGEGPGILEGTVQDITERKLVEEEVRYLAFHDSLTGLGNRRLFKDRLKLALDQARRDSDESAKVGVIFLDIDHFKVINDTLGHSIGDHLLQGVADRLVTRMCVGQHLPGSADPPALMVSRFGGDEFTVLLSRIRDPQDAASVAERILDALSDPFRLGNEEIVITASIGITTWPQDGEDAEALLRNCDTAMYHAKTQGRNNYQFYTESMQEDAFKRLQLHTQLRGAIERQEFQLWYQPKVAAETGRVTGLEALLRWQEPNRGIVLPGEFIPVAEETGLIVTIGEWVLRTALRQVREWRDQGLRSVCVSVNVSAHQIQADGFVQTVAIALEQLGLEPSCLDLEITESTLMEDEGASVVLLRELKDLGVSLSLDDFGTGYSSLSYLRRFPFDTLKIDRSFVSRVATDPDDAGLVAAIIAMAKVLRMRVVAEGIETEEQRQALCEMGCDEIQGYLFGMPAPAEQVAELLKPNRPPRKPEPPAS